MIPHICGIFSEKWDVFLMFYLFTMCIYANIYIYICIHTHDYIRIYNDLYIYIYIYIYIHTHIYVHIYIYRYGLLTTYMKYMKELEKYIRRVIVDGPSTW